MDIKLKNRNVNTLIVLLTALLLCICMLLLFPSFYAQAQRGYANYEERTIYYTNGEGTIIDTRPLYEHEQWSYFAEEFGDAGFWLVFVASLTVMSVLAVVAAVRRTAGVNALERMALEVSIGAGIAAAFLAVPVSFIGIYALSGELLLSGTIFYFTGNTALLVGYAVSFLLLYLACVGWYYALVSALRVTKVGLKEYCLKSVLCIRVVLVCLSWVRVLGRWIKGLGQRMYKSITGFSLSEFGIKTIIKLLLIHFVILFVICCFWMFGFVLLIGYIVVLFFFLRRYTRDITKNYNTLLSATGEMAQGRLHVKIEEDLGVFKPLWEELKKVQQGFRAAVNAETKSQRMKTELISNVSHDLKTPLTAIITYVDLLKDESITAEERRRYVETLERKSQRLKRLIEDLFEMSKANAGDTVLHLREIDIVALIRQVQSELTEEMESAEIEFRNAFPEDTVYLHLDGEKTSRIFENLFQNVAKYALKGTRAYVHVHTDEEQVVAEVKNISRDELRMEANDLTGRFVRGDQSRNTEGSGLGLAIAASFASLQGGALTVELDGDLFKVTVTFPLFYGDGIAGQARNDVDLRSD